MEALEKSFRTTSGELKANQHTLFFCRMLAYLLAVEIKEHSYFSETRKVQESFKGFRVIEAQCNKQDRLEHYAEFCLKSHHNLFGNLLVDFTLLIIKEREIP